MDATLGFVIDSSQAAPAAAALDKLTAAASSAQVAASKLGPASTAANAALNKTKAASDDAAHSHAGFSTQAMAAQHAVRGFTEMMIQGVPPTRALAMEANNLSYAMTHPGGLIGAMKEGISVFSRFLTLPVLVGGAVAGLGAAFYLAYQSVKSTEIEFANLADRAGTTVTALHGLQEAASFQGIDQTDFLAQMTKFSAAVNDAQHGEGALGETLRANGMQAKTFNDYLAKAADLVANAASEQDKYRMVQALGLQPTYQMVQFLSQGADAIKNATQQANSFGDAAEKEMIQKARDFDTAWAHVWQEFKDEAKGAIIDAGGFIDTLIQKARGLAIKFDKATGGDGRTIPMNILTEAMRGQPTFGANPTRLTQHSNTNDFYNGFGSTFTNTPTPKSTQTAPDRLKSLQNYQTMVNLLGDLATTDQVVKAKEDALAAAFIQSGVSVGKYRDAILALTAAQHDYSRASLQASLGVQTFDPAVMAAKELAANIKAGLVPLDQQGQALTALTQKWKSLAEQAQVAGSKFPNLTQLGLDAGDVNKQLDQLATGSLNQLSTDLAKVADGTMSVGDAFKDMANYVVSSLEKMIIQMTIIQPLAKSLQSSLGGGLLGSSLLGGGGGLLGILGGIFHDGGVVGVDAGPKRYVHPAYFENAPRFHTGGIVPGEVPAILKPGEGVFTPGQMRALGSGNQQPIRLEVVSRVDKDGNIRTFVEGVSGAVVANAAPHIINAAGKQVPSIAAASSHRQSTRGVRAS